MKKQPEGIIFFDDFERWYVDSHYAARENAYLKSVGLDPESLSREQRKSLLFGFRYGSRSRLSDRTMREPKAFTTRARIYDPNPQTLYLTYKPHTRIAYTISLAGRPRQRYDGFDQVVHYRDFPDTREGWTVMTQLMMEMMDPTREVAPTTYETLMGGRLGGKTAIIDRFGRTATPFRIRPDGGEPLRGLHR